MLDTPNLLNILPRIQINSMPKTSKVKKKVSKSKTASKPKSAATVSKTKETNKYCNIPMHPSPK